MEDEVFNKLYKKLEETHENTHYTKEQLARIDQHLSQLNSKVAKHEEEHQRKDGEIKNVNESKDQEIAKLKQEISIIKQRIAYIGGGIVAVGSIATIVAKII